MGAIARWSHHELASVLLADRAALAWDHRTLLRSRRIPEQRDVKDAPAGSELGAGALVGLAQTKRRNRHMHHLARDPVNP